MTQKRPLSERQPSERERRRLAFRVVCGCGESVLTEDADEAARIAHKFSALHPDDGPVHVWSLKPFAMTVRSGRVEEARRVRR